MKGFTTYPCRPYLEGRVSGFRGLGVRGLEFRGLGVQEFRGLGVYEAVVGLGVQG